MKITKWVFMANLVAVFAQNIIMLRYININHQMREINNQLLESLHTCTEKLHWRQAAMDKTQFNLTQSDLDQFTGTEKYYQHSLVRSVVYTDGVHYLAEHGAEDSLMADFLQTTVDTAEYDDMNETEILELVHTSNGANQRDRASMIQEWTVTGANGES